MTNMAQGPDVEITRLADVIYMFNERQRVIDRDSQTSNTASWATVLTKPSIRFRALVAITMASVLSWFIDKPFRSSQCWTARKHSDSLGVELSSLSAMYSCASSANCVWFIPNEPMTFASEEIYSVNSSGPSTDPWGTLQSQTMLNDCERQQVRANLVKCWAKYAVSKKKSPQKSAWVLNAEDRSNCSSIK